MRHTRTFARFTSVMSVASLEEPSVEVLRGIDFTDAMPLEANVPLRLDDPDAIWVVVSGEVDLFHVRASSDAYLANRRYVGTLWAGEVVMGALPTGDGDDGVLIAVGFGGATLQRAARSAIDEATGDEARIARALAKGVGELIGRAMYRAGRATARPVDPSNGRLVLEPGATITAGTDVVWLRIEQGTLSLGGDIAVSRPTLVVPLARGMWLTAGATGATVTVLDTLAAFATKRVGEALEYLWDIFLAWLTFRAAADDAVERTRLERKTAGERARLAGALASLSSLLQGRGDTAPVERRGEALLDACTIVGQHAGIAFRAPPTLDEAAPPPGARLGADPYRDAVMRICDASHVRARQVTVRGDWWRRDAGPLLGFRGPERHPVALLPGTNAPYVMHDPAAGEAVPLTPALAATILPDAWTFYTPAPAGVLTLRALGGLLRRDVLPDFTRVLGFVGAGAALGLAMPLVIGIMFNQVIPSANMGNAVTLVVSLLAVAAAVALIDIARAFALIRAESRSNALLQSAIIDRLLSLPPQFFRQYSVGDLAMRAEAVNLARQQLTGVALQSLFGGALVVTSLALMAWYSGRLAMVAIGVLLVSAVVTAAVGLYALPYERQRQALMGRIGTLVFELLGGIGKLHVAAAEARMFALWGARFRALKVVTFKAGLASAALAVFNTMLPILAGAAIFTVSAGVLAAEGKLTTGDFVAFYSAFGTALAAGIGVSTTLVSVLNVVPLFERATPILVAAPEVDEAKPDVGAISGRIEMAQVTFSYIAGAPPILDEISFEIRPGEFVAFVGPSGSGKSTILRLLLGFEKPDRGAVYYDGHDLASIDVGAIRRQSAVVLQHSKLLAGDIFTNIVGASQLTHEDAWRAADLAGLAEDIEAMPMGMHTVISEGGSTLSGGQRQRLLIARALVRDPRVVFFDEATSALDNRSQDIVTRSLERLEATRIVIAHRLTTVQRADRIFVMTKGRIVQQGSYEELVEADGMFKDLARRQLV